MDHPLNIFRSSSDADSDKDSRVTPPTKSSSYPSTPPPLSSPTLPLTSRALLPPSAPSDGGDSHSSAMTKAGGDKAGVAVSVEAPLELFYHRWDERWLLRSVFSRYDPFYCTPDESGQTAEVSSSNVDSCSKWHPQTLLQDMLRTRRRISESRLIVNFLIYFSGLVLTMVCGVTGACLNPTTQSVTSIGALTIMTGLMTGAFNALSAVYTAWEQEVVAAQMTLNTRFSYIPIPYSPVPVSFGMLSTATAPADKEAAAATTKKGQEKGQ